MASLPGRGGAQPSPTMSGEDTESHDEYFLQMAAFSGVDQVTRRRLQREALEAVKAELTTPADLFAKVARLRQACVREARDVRRGIVTLCSGQVAEARKATALLAQSRDSLAELKVTFRRISRLVKGRQSTEGFASLRTNHIFSTNVGAIVGWAEKLQQLKAAKLGEYCDEHRPRLAELYTIVREVQKIRRSVRDATDGGTRFHEEMDVLQPYFDKADAAAAVLAKTAQGVLEQCLERCVNSLPDEDDEDEDNGDAGGVHEELRPLFDCITICRWEAKFGWLRLRGASAEDDLEESPLSRAAAEAMIAESIDGYWSDVLLEGVVDQLKDAPAVFAGMKKGAPLFAIVEEVLLPVSTEDFPVMLVALKALHARFVGTLRLLGENRTSMLATQLLEGMSFTQFYAASLEKQGFAQQLDTKPVLRCQELFLDGAVDGLHEHMASLAAKVATRVLSDPEKEIPGSGVRFTSGPVDLLYVLQQSLAPVTSRVELRVLRRLVVSSAFALKTYLDALRAGSDKGEWMDREEEQQPDVPMTPQRVQEIGDARMMKLCAFCNDMTKLESNIELIETKFTLVLSADEEDDGDGDFDVEEEVADAASGSGAAAQRGGAAGAAARTGGAAAAPGVAVSAAGATTAALEACRNPFQECIMPELPFASGYFLDEVLHNIGDGVLADTWKALFYLEPFGGPQSGITGQWRSGDNNPLAVIALTVKDYLFSDPSGLVRALEETWFTKLLRQSIPYFTGKYIATLTKFLGDHKGKECAVNDEFASCLSRDVTAWEEMWRDVFAQAPGGSTPSLERLLGTSTALLAGISAMAAAGTPERFSAAVSMRLLDDYGDCPTVFVQRLVDRRLSVDKAVREAMHAAWRNAVRYQERDPATDTPTQAWTKGTSLLATAVRQALAEAAQVGAKPKRGFFSRQTAEEKAAEEKRLAKEKRKADARERKEREKAGLPPAGAASPAGGGARGGRGGGGGGQDDEPESLAAVLGGK